MTGGWRAARTVTKERTRATRAPVAAVVGAAARTARQATAVDLAAVALELSKFGRPPTIHFGWTDESPVSGTLGFLLFGEGNVPWEVRELLLKGEPDPARRPKVMIADS